MAARAPRGAAGAGRRGVPAITRGAPGPRGAHDLPGDSWRDQMDGDFSGQSFRWRGQRRGASERRPRRGEAPDRAGGRELGRGCGSYLPMALPPGASARHPPISLRRSNGQVPQTPGSRSRRGGGQWGAGPGPPSARAPQSAAHRPFRWHLGSWLPSAALCPSGPRPITPARSEGARRLAFSSASGRCETKHQDRLANDRPVVARRRVERRTPSLKRGI